MFIMALPNNLILVHQITPLRCAHVATVLCRTILYTAFSNKHCTIKHTPNFTRFHNKYIIRNKLQSRKPTSFTVYISFLRI